MILFRHYLLEAVLLVVSKITFSLLPILVMRGCPRLVGRLSRHAVLPVVCIRRNTHAFLIRGVEGLLHEFKLSLSLLFNLSKPLLLFVDFFLYTKNLIIYVFNFFV